MHSRGNIKIYFIVLQLLVLALIIGVIFKEAGSVDVEFFRSTFSVRNLALTMSTISFMPANIIYNYPTSADKELTNWQSFYIDFKNQTINYRLDLKDSPYAFKYLAFEKIQAPDSIFEVRKDSILIDHTDSFEMQSKDADPRLLKCNTKKYDLQLGQLNSGDPQEFYHPDGKLAQGQPETNYLGLEKHYFIGEDEVYPGLKGKTKSTIVESVITKTILDQTGLHYKSNIRADNLDEPHLLLTIGNYSSSDSFIIAKLPFKDYEQNYDSMCTLLNSFILHTSKQTSSSIHGILLMPHHDRHTILEIGNINNPLLFNDNSLKEIAGVMKDGRD